MNSCKRFSIIFAALITLLFAFNISAFADDESINAEYNSESEIVSISGCFPSKVNTAVTITILPQGTDIGSLTFSTLSSKMFPIRQTKTDIDGYYSIELAMSDGLESGIYTVSATCGGKRIKADFSYIVNSDIMEIIKRINSANKGEISKILSDNATLLDLSDIDLNYIDDISSYLYNDIPTGGFKESDFRESLKRSIALAYIKNNDDVIGTIKKYGQYFDVQTEQISENEINLIPSYVKSESNAKTKEILNRSIILAKLKSSENYADTENIVKTYGKNAGMVLDAYNTLSSVKRTEVLKSVFEKSFASFSDFNTYFNNIVKEKANSNTNTSGGGSSSSGGLGSGFVGFNNVPDKNNKEDDSQAADNKGKHFTDIENHWAKDYIENLNIKGIINGYDDNTIRPNDTVTRAEFVKMLLVAIGGEMTSNQYFSDCTETDWYFKYVSGAKENGIINGYGDKFGPNDHVTRQDAATMIYRTLGIEETGEAKFEDTDDISEYAKGAVGFLSSHNVINGNNGKFLPKNNTTRAEAAVMIYKLLNNGVLEEYSNNNQNKSTDSYKEAYGLVSSISNSDQYMSFSGNDLCTRGIFLSAVMSVVGVKPEMWTGASFDDVQADGDLYGFLSYAVQNGIIPQEDSFRPNDVISFEDLEKICINAFGYGPLAVMNGGDAKAYSQLASQINLSQGVNIGDGISTAEAYRIIYNMLNAKDIVKEYSGSEVIYKMSDTTILANHYRIKTITGIMTANEYTAINDLSASDVSALVRKGTIAIDGTKYISSYDCNDYIGCNVRAYIKNDGLTDDDEVVFVYEVKNKTVEINLYDISYKNDYICDEVTNRKYKINKSFDAVVNGKYDPEFKLDMLNDISGTVKLVSNNQSSDYNILIVTYYEYMKVATFDRQNLVISEMKNPDTRLTIPEESITSIVSMADGDDVELSDITSGSYLAYSASKDKEIIKLILLDDTVDGVISSISNDEAVINSTTYRVSPYFSKNSMPNLKVGFDGSYVIGLFSDIIAVDNIENALKYGYFVSAWTDSAYDNRIFLRIFTQDGEMKNLITTDRVVIDGVANKNISETYKEFFAKPCLIKFGLNSEGEVNIVDLPEEMNFFKDNDTANLNAYNNLTRNIVGDENDKYYYLSGTLYPSIVTNGAIVFRIPNDRTKYEAYDLGFEFDEGYLSDGKDLEAYDVGFDGGAKVLCAFVDEQSAVYVTSPSIVVEKVIEKVDDEGNVRKAVSGWSDGKYVEYFLADNINIEKRKKAGELEIGDIIRVHLRNNEIRSLYVDFIGKKFMMNYINGTGLANFNSRTTNYQYRAGGVYSMENGSALIAKLVKRNNNDADQYIDYTYSAGNFVLVDIPDSVVRVDLANNKVTVTDRNAINTYLNSGTPSRVVVKTYRGRATYCVIYEGLEE